MSEIGLGCNNFGGRLDQAATTLVVDAALEAGITLFDTADIYGGQGGSESQLGVALKGRREAVVLATKFGMDMGGSNGDASAGRGHPDYVRRACEASLRRLGTDHIDLYQYHEPDGVTPLAETLGAMHALVEEGKVGAIGLSNVNAAEIEEGGAVTRIATVQNEYNLLNRDLEDEVLPACERLGIGILPYFPLASGRLSGKYRRGEAPPAGTRLHGREVASDEQFDQLEALAGFAQAREISMVDVAIGALLAQPMVSSVIAGATKPEQVAQNVAAASWRPTAADLAEIDSITPPPAA